MSPDHSFHLNPLAVEETARFFSIQRARALECLAARFRSHAYAPHTHDSFVVGTIVAGCETFSIGGTRYYARPGHLVLIDPGVVHDGEPAGDGFAYRISYPSAELLLELAADACERDPAGPPHFARPIVADAELADRLAAVHRLAEAGGDALELDEKLLGFFVRLLARHGGTASPVQMERHLLGERGPVARAIDYLDACFFETVDLATLSEVAGIPRTRLIRAMRRETGLTPHAWLTDRRIRAARRMLAEGGPPADVAVACGFYDQSHLNRAFKARVGVSPGVFRAAIGADSSGQLY
ncbi:MAG TPA: AraC family transcriptional regulator [Rhizobiaceae bacterium]|nr:AraC family transcriptional regulator [Rhizobiaceae bacterium]